MRWNPVSCSCFYVTSLPRGHPSLLPPPISSSPISLWPLALCEGGSILEWQGRKSFAVWKPLQVIWVWSPACPLPTPWQTSAKGCPRASQAALLQPHFLAALFTSAEPSVLVIPTLRVWGSPFFSLLALTSFHQTFQKIPFSSSQRTDLSSVYFLFVCLYYSGTVSFR